MSDNRLTFRYDLKKIKALRLLAELEKKKTSQIIREALDDRLKFVLEGCSEPEDVCYVRSSGPS